MSLKPFKRMKTEVQKVVTDPQVRSAVKQAIAGLILGVIAEKVAALKTGKKANGMLGLALNIGFNLILPNRYKLLKTVGAMVVGAIVMRVKMAKEKKRFAQVTLYTTDF